MAAPMAAVPGKLDPPVVGKVTYHTIELYWHPPARQQTTGDALLYCVEEEDVEKRNGFVMAYKGYDTRHTFTGLTPSTVYRYRVRAVSDTVQGRWSPSVSVSTTRQSISCEQLHKAIIQNDVTVARSILENESKYLDSPDIYGSSPLMAACKKGRAKIVELLISLGADIEWQNSSGKTSLMEACYYGHKDCAMLLNGSGASWLTRDSSGMSAIHYAVDGGQSEVVEMLLNSGVPVDDTSSDTVSGWTPLLRLAATNGNTAIARVLIHHGADVNQRDDEDRTPLMLGALGGHTELVSLLLMCGCDPSMTNKYGKTALDFATSFGREEVTKLLRKFHEQSTSSQSVSKYRV